MWFANHNVLILPRLRVSRVPHICGAPRTRARSSNQLSPLPSRLSTFSPGESVSAINGANGARFREMGTTSSSQAPRPSSALERVPFALLSESARAVPSKREKFHPLEPKVTPKSLQRFPTRQDGRTAPEPRRNSRKNAGCACAVAPSLPLRSASSLHLLPLYTQCFIRDIVIFVLGLSVIIGNRFLPVPLQKLWHQQA